MSRRNNILDQTWRLAATRFMRCHYIITVSTGKYRSIVFGDIDTGMLIAFRAINLNHLMRIRKFSSNYGMRIRANIHTRFLVHSCVLLKERNPLPMLRFMLVD